MQRISSLKNFPLYLIHEPFSGMNCWKCLEFAFHIWRRWCGSDVLTTGQCWEAGHNPWIQWRKFIAHQDRCRPLSPKPSSWDICIPPVSSQSSTRPLAHCEFSWRISCCTFTWRQEMFWEMSLTRKFAFSHTGPVWKISEKCLDSSPCLKAALMSLFGRKLNTGLVRATPRQTWSCYRDKRFYLRALSFPHIPRNASTHEITLHLLASQSRQRSAHCSEAAMFSTHQSQWEMDGPAVAQTWSHRHAMRRCSVNLVRRHDATVIGRNQGDAFEVPAVSNEMVRMKRVETRRGKKEQQNLPAHKSYIINIDTWMPRQNWEIWRSPWAPSISSKT